MRIPAAHPHAVWVPGEPAEAWWCVVRKLVGLLFISLCLGCSTNLETPEGRYEATVQARAWFENGDPDRASKMLERLARDSKDAVAWTNFGLARYRAGDRDGAENAWHEAVAIDRSAAGAHFWLGVSARDRAQEELRAATNDSRDASERQESAKKLLLAAARSLEAAEDANPLEPLVPRTLALVYDDLAQSDAAGRARTEAARLDPVGIATLDGSRLATVQLPPHPRPSSAGRIPVRFTTQEAPFRAAGLTLSAAGSAGQPELLLLGTSLRIEADSSRLRWRADDLVPGQRITAAVRADVNGDGRVDDVVFTRTNDLPGSRAWLVRAGSSDVRQIAEVAYTIESVRAIDLEPDGDTDLVLAAPGAPGLRVWRNNGGSLVVDAPCAGLEELPAEHDVVCGDFNDDHRSDLVCIDRAGVLRLLVQRSDGGFTDVTRLSGLASVRVRACATADMDADGCTDLLIGNDEGLWVYRNRGNARFAREAVYSTLQTRYVHERGTRIPVLALQVTDVDNDGLPDILTVHPRDPIAPVTLAAAGNPETGRGGGEDTAPAPLAPAPEGPAGLRLWRNDGRGVLLDASERLEVVGDTLLVRAPVFGDFDLDGDQDIAGIRADSAVVVMWNDGGNVNRRIWVELVGPRGRRDGYGARLELHIGALVQSFEVERQPVWVGIQNQTRLRLVRVVWPDGKVENRLDLPVPEDGELRIARGDSNG